MKKINNIVGQTLFLASLLLGGSACTDQWNDHYQEVNVGEGTLWQSISRNPQLKNFAAVLEACGYKAELDGEQMFTVFAPQDDKFTSAMADSVIALYKSEVADGKKPSRNAAIKEFVKNHIARYNYSVSSLTNDSIVMMNRKNVLLTGNNFAGFDMVGNKVAASNGMLYTISDMHAYTPNIYEYIRRDADLDSLANFVYKYNNDYFDASQSVPGEIINGQIQYLDSVTYLTNEILSWMNANLSAEDSTFWLLAPNNAQWKSTLTQYEKYFQYDKKVKGRDSLAYMLPRVCIVMGTAFSETINPAKSAKDSVFSTLACTTSNERLSTWGSYDAKYYQFDRPFDEGGIFAATTDVQCSNGLVRKPETWNVKPTQTFARKRVIEAESAVYLDSVFSNVTKEPNYKSVASNNPFYNKVSNHGVMEFAPTSAAPFKAIYSVSNILSNVKYNVYAVIAPVTAIDTLQTGLPNKFRVSIMCHDTSGAEKWIKGSKQTAVSYNKASGELTINAQAASKVFENDPTKVDTILVAENQVFPTCSMNLDQPQVKVVLESRRLTTDTGYAEKMLFDCFLFVPVEE